MLFRVVAMVSDFAAAREADRLVRNCGTRALDMARHAVRASGEGSRSGYWTRVLAQVERRSGHRPW